MNHYDMLVSKLCGGGKLNPIFDTTQIEMGRDLQNAKQGMVCHDDSDEPRQAQILINNNNINNNKKQQPQH